jgi:hypothetical protein
MESCHTMYCHAAKQGIRANERTSRSTSLLSRIIGRRERPEKPCMLYHSHTLFRMPFRMIGLAHKY